MADEGSSADENDGWDSAVPTSPDHILALSLLERAQALTEFDDGAALDPVALDEAIRLFDEIVQRFGTGANVRLQEVVADALFRKSQALFDLDRPDDAIRIAYELNERISASPELSLRKRLCHALYVTAWSLRGGGPDRASTAVEMCREAIRRFGGEQGLWFRKRLLHLMIEQSFALKAFERRAEGVALRNATVARYRDDPDLALREHAERVIAAMDERFEIEDAEKL